MKFDSAQQNMITNVFESLNDANINYVVLRGHQDLPERTPGGDIDLLIDFSEFEWAISIFKSKNITTRRGGSAFKLGKKIKRNPITAINLLIMEPRSVPNQIRSIVSSDPEQLRKGLSETKLYKNDIMFHCTNHLAYKSPMNGCTVRVDPQLEKYLFENRVKVSGHYIPSHTDELLHLVCRGVFDYGGDFPDYYRSRCTELWENISSEQDQVDSLTERLQLVFYSADELVLKHIENQKYNHIRNSLRQFSDY